MSFYEWTQLSQLSFLFQNFKYGHIAESILLIELIIFVD